MELYTTELYFMDESNEQAELEIEKYSAKVYFDYKSNDLTISSDLISFNPRRAVKGLYYAKVLAQVNLKWRHYLFNIQCMHIYTYYYSQFFLDIGQFNKLVLEWFKFWPVRVEFGY